MHVEKWFDRLKEGSKKVDGIKIPPLECTTFFVRCRVSTEVISNKDVHRFPVGGKKMRRDELSCASDDPAASHLLSFINH